MRRNISGKNPILVEDLFFSRTWDFLHVYIPKQKDGSSSTVKNYRQGLKSFRIYVNEVAGISTNKFLFKDCTYDFVLDYRNHLHEVKDYKETTVNNRLAVLKSYMKYVSARDISLQQFTFSISEVPFLRTPVIMQPIIEDTEALAAILGMPKNTLKGLRDKALMSVLYDSGIRVQELVSLELKDVRLDTEEMYLHIHGKGNKERNICLSEKTAALVRQYVKEFHPDRNKNAPFIYTVVKGKQDHMSIRNIQKLIKKYADKAKNEYTNLPDTVSPHTFRRTRGTNLYRDGVELPVVSLLLGHADTKTTREHYASPSIEQMRDALSKGTDVVPEEEPLWPDDEDEISRICGLV